jgi:hypothetical protein
MMSAFGMGGFETPKQEVVRETLYTNPEKLQEQTLESLPAFLGLEETPEMQTLREQIISDAKGDSRETFARALNPYLIALDRVILSTQDDERRQMLEVAGMLTEAYFYHLFANDEGRSDDAKEQAIDSAYGYGQLELANVIEAKSF